MAARRCRNEASGTRATSLCAKEEITMDLLSADPLGTLEASLQELQQAVESVEAPQMDIPANCEPWTVRQLASHALNNQLFWAGLATGNELVSAEDTMRGVP